MVQTKRDLLLPILRWIYEKNVAVYTWILVELGVIYATIKKNKNSNNKNFFIKEDEVDYKQRALDAGAFVVTIWFLLRLWQFSL